jgi:phospholipase D1/2
LDSDFKIERPTRYFRQGLNLLHPDAEQAVGDAKDKAAVQMLSVAYDARSRRSLVGTIRSGVSKVLHRHRASSLDGHPRASTTTRGRSNSIGSSHSSASSDEGPEHHTEPAMLDPSMNVNPLVDEQQGIRHAHEGSSNGNKKKKKAADVSKHVFYVENSQTRLKLYAKNEVSCILFYLATVD